MQKLMLLLLMLPGLLLASEIAPIPAYSAQYDVSREGMKIGETIRSYTVDDQQIGTFEAYTKTTGIAAWFVKDKVLERSTFSYQPPQIVPLTYLYSRTGGKKERHAELTFDWENKRITNDVDQTPWKMELPLGTLDKYVYQIQVMIDLGLGKTRMDYLIADGGKLKNYPLEVVGEEQLKTKLGKLDTVVLKKVGDKRKTTMWCAKELNYLPVRITQTETDGSDYEAEIISLSGM